jgi:hypothetical protein
VGLNPYFYRAKEGDEGMNKDGEWDGAQVVGCFFTIPRKKKDRERFIVLVGGALM